MKRSHILAFCALVLVTSCIPTIPAIPPQEGDWQLLVTTNEANSRLIRFSQPNNRVVNVNLFLAIDSIRGIDGNVGKIVMPTLAYREYIFVILPQAKRIEVLSSITYKRVTTINFASQNRIPTDIVFLNATNGLIAFENESVVSVLDLTNFRVATDIFVGKNPVDLEVRQVPNSNINEVYCAVRGENQVVVIAGNGANSYTVIDRISVPTAPQYLQVTPNKSEVIVICAGASNPRTPTRVAKIDATTRRVIRESILAPDPADSLTEQAYGLVISEKEFAYIPMTSGMVRLDIRELTRQTLYQGFFRNVTINPNRSEVVFVDSVTKECTILATNSRIQNDSLKNTFFLDSLRASIRQVNTQ